MPEFSVVIPVYNRQELILQTLETVFAQTFSDFEVICIDDGSTDQSRQILLDLTPRIRLVTQQNRGPGAARNLGIRYATGRYIVFLDSDDLWPPWTLSTYHQVIHRCAPTLVAGSFQPFWNGTPPRELAPEAPSFEIYPDYLATSLQSRHILLSAVAVEASALRRVGGFNDEDEYAEDWDLLLRLGASGPFALVSAPVLAFYRRHPASAVANVDRTVAGVRNLIDSEERGRYPGGARRALERRRIQTRHIRPVSIKLLTLRRLAQAWQLYWRTFQWHIADRRWTYLVGFPLLAARALLGWPYDPWEKKQDAFNHSRRQSIVQLKENV